MPPNATGRTTSDHHHSYPSPISTATSPNLEESRQIVESSQQSLRAASNALQATYRRIRHIRRSLDLSNDAMPSPDGSMGPNYSALLLTASPVDDDESDPEDLQDRQDSLSWNDHTSVPPPPRLRGLQLPSPSPSTFHSSRRFFDLARTTLSTDDGATFLGRSVAQLSPMDSVLRAAEMERELLHWRTVTRRTDPGLTASRADALSRSDIIRNARSLDTEAPPQLSIPSHAWPPRSSRWRLYRSNGLDTRQSSSSTQPPSSAQPRTRPPPADRLSLLSNFSSMQNLSTPTSALPRDRPLLFEEPQSYDVNSRRESRDIAESAAEQRSYFIHRRLNADGDELVHNINLDWDEDDPLTWIMPPTQFHQNPRRRRARYRLTDPEERILEPIPVAPGPEPRRRGWARLDPDGNAIPSDEEEELERERSEYRVRALYQARASAAAVSNRVEREAQSSVEVPDSGAFSNLVTRTSVFPDDGYEGGIHPRPRVRLGSRETTNAFPPPRMGYGSVMDSVLAVDTRPPRQASTRRVDIPTDVPYGSAEPFVIDPLPIPLSEMVPWGTKHKNRVSMVGVRVSKNAAFAGR
ncbi:hypothetical protein C8F01DRAFT_1110320 [Mycena amicta]|nr:hypothetical protein C8F01DRAFT_1110320 [Mycena amicta]